jgi:hypothetical protein
MEPTAFFDPSVDGLNGGFGENETANFIDWKVFQ